MEDEIIIAYEYISNIRFITQWYHLFM